MKKNKVNLKKINKANNSTVRTLACHCSCGGNPISAIGKSYIAQFM